MEVQFIIINLECKIERLRQKLHITTLQKPLTHPDVLRVSQRLDEVINKHCKLPIIHKTR